MNREAFLKRLADGLQRLPTQLKAEILADYERYFADGAARGRTDDETAIALGDPARLAREHGVEAAMSRWEAERSPSSALAIVFGVATLDVIGLVFLAPLVLTTVAALLTWLLLVTAAFMAGVHFTFFAPFDAPTQGPLAPLLRGVGFLAAAVSGGAGLALVIKVLHAALSANLAWLVRLHQRAGRGILPIKASQGDQR